MMGAGPGSLGDGSPPVWPRGKSPVGGQGDEVPQKLKQNVKLVYIFNVFLYKILDKSRAWRIYFANTQYKFFEDSMGGALIEPPNTHSGLASG